MLFVKPRRLKAFVLFFLAAILSCTLRAQAATSFKVLYNFSSQANGKLPSGALTIGKTGSIFGTTFQGGDFNEGVAYELSPSQGGSWTEKVIHSFAFTDGEPPVTGVILDDGGSVYGATPAGGPNGTGTVFQITPSGGDWLFTLLYSSGSAGLIFDTKGNLYRSTGLGKYQEGAVSELSPGPDGWSSSDLYSFCAQPPQCTDGEAPDAPLVFDATGNLYGTTLYGGNEIYCVADTYGCGVAFQLKPNQDGSWTYHLLHAFATDLSDGETPTGALVVDHSGSLYGATIFGGPTGGGTVYRLVSSSVGQVWKETKLYTFPDCVTGCTPTSGLAIDAAGNLYGAAGGGNTLCAGSNYCGVVYKLSPVGNNKWKYSVLHKFSGTDGFGPLGVTVGSDGNLYGTTQLGGKNNLGVVFEITP